MCLKSRMGSLEEVLRHVPDDEFVVFKVVAKQGGELRSPHYNHCVWHPGNIVSDGRYRGNGDVGLYCFLVEPHPGLILKAGGQHAAGGDRVLRLSAKKEDVVWGGRDDWNGKNGTCLVLKKVHLSQEDYQRAMSDQEQAYLVEQVTVQAKADVKEVKEQVEEKKEEARQDVEAAKMNAQDEAERREEVGQKVVKKVKKTVKKTAAKETAKKSADSKKGKTLVKKAKKEVKKPAKKSVKKPSAKKGEKLASSAKKSVKSKKATSKLSTSEMNAGKRLADKAKKQVKKNQHD